MLILQRFAEQWVVVEVGGERLEILVQNVSRRNGAVKLGFQASHHVRVWRKELEEKAQDGLELNEKGPAVAAADPQ